MANDAPPTKDWGAMTPAQEVAFNQKVEKHFRGQRELPDGRDFRCFNRTETEADRQKYRDNYDGIRWD